MCGWLLSVNLDLSCDWLTSLVLEMNLSQIELLGVLWVIMWVLHERCVGLCLIQTLWNQLRVSREGIIFIMKCWSCHNSCRCIRAALIAVLWACRCIVLLLQLLHLCLHGGKSSLGCSLWLWRMAHTHWCTSCCAQYWFLSYAQHVWLLSWGSSSKSWSYWVRSASLLLLLKMRSDLC